MMNYSIEELKTYLGAVSNVLSDFGRGKNNDKYAESKERLSTNEFSELCRDLMLSALKFNVDGIATGSIGSLEGELQVVMTHGKLHRAIGVVAASPCIPEQRLAQELIADALNPGWGFGVETVYPAQQGFEAKAKATGFNGESLKQLPDYVFDKAAQGYMLASDFSLLFDRRLLILNLPAMSDFFTRLEITRDKSPDWDRVAPTIRGVFSAMADQSPIGRKDPSMAKILRLTRDGAELVSVSDCVEATKGIFEGLAETDRTTCEVFTKNLDILDDHSSFYEIAFQSEFLELTRKAAFMDRGFQYHSMEGRVNFAKNLQVLIPRLQGRVADPKILLAGFLLGSSVTEAMTLKDRAQGNPLWLEHAILDRARDPRPLANPGSSLSVVINVLLESVNTADQKAFWEARPERGYHRPVAKGQDFSR